MDILIIIISPDNKSVSPVLTTVVLSDYELINMVKQLIQ